VTGCDWNLVSGITVSLGGFVAGNANTVALFADSTNAAPDIDWIEVMTGTSIAKIDPTLAGYWKFDEGQGATLVDSSGTGNDATITNPRSVGWTTSSASLPSLQFTNKAALALGSGGYATAGTSSLPANNASQTMSAWINLNSTSGTDQYIVSLWNPATTQALSLGIHSGQLTVWKWGPGVLVSMAPPALNSWHHVAYTFDGRTHKLYIDGKTPATGTAAPNASPVTVAEIGAWSGAGSFHGQIDELRVYNVALSATQIAQLAAGAP
jgi:hypothetical protein